MCNCAVILISKQDINFTMPSWDLFKKIVDNLRERERARLKKLKNLFLYRYILQWHDLKKWRVDRIQKGKTSYIYFTYLSIFNSEWNINSFFSNFSNHITGIKKIISTSHENFEIRHTLRFQSTGRKRR